MTKYSKNQSPSPETQEEALKIARATQRPGQAKEHTKLIARGIQKGIDEYKKQQKTKARELDRKIKKAANQQQQNQTPVIQTQMPAIKQRHWLPWMLLVLSWLGFAILLLLMD